MQSNLCESLDSPPFNQQCFTVYLAWINLRLKVDSRISWRIFKCMDSFCTSFPACALYFIMYSGYIYFIYSAITSNKVLVALWEESQNWLQLVAGQLKLIRGCSWSCKLACWLISWRQNKGKLKTSGATMECKAGFGPPAYKTQILKSEHVFDSITCTA